MCWQGEKPSEYIQGANEHIKYTQRFAPSLAGRATLTATCFVVPSEEERMRLTFRAPSRPPWERPTSTGWVNRLHTFTLIDINAGCHVKRFFLTSSHRRRLQSVRVDAPGRRERESFNGCRFTFDQFLIYKILTVQLFRRV